ncbi:MAG: hypothetical protein ACR2RL_09170 [Gammaproteobacteria bacterium]
MIEVRWHQMMTVELFREWLDVPLNLAADRRFALIECADYAQALHEAGATLHHDAAGRVFVRIDALQPI